MRENLLKARHHIVFLLALAVGSVLIYFLNEIDLRKQGYGTINLKQSRSKDTTVEQRQLTAQEREWAKVAWRYFEHNYNPQNGLVNSVDRFPSTTLWDSGNYLVALISAERLGIVTQAQFDERLTKILTTLASLELYDGKLPNKVYNTQTLKMTDYNNNQVVGGIGWSVIDIGRILVPLSYITRNHPQHNEKVKRLLAQWDFGALQKKGELYGAIKEGDKEYLLQEGRLGYEQYAAKVFALFGIDSLNSMRYDRFLDFEDIYGIEIPYDIRDSGTFFANNYVLMEPYMLDGLEFGWDYFSKEFSYRLYEVQKERYERSNILTAVSEDHIDTKPYFIYNSIFVNNQKWVAIDEKGNLYQDKKLLSTKASFAMHALYRSDYTQKLLDTVSKLTSQRGWYGGVYERDQSINKALSCNTNAVILSSLLYIQEGALLSLR
jgi:hypothetical protein